MKYREPGIHKKPKKHRKQNSIPDRAVHFLTEFFHVSNLARGNRRLKRELIGLASGRRIRVEEYYAGKIKILMLVVSAGLCLSCGMFLAEFLMPKDHGRTVLERPDYGEDARSEELEAELENGESRRLEISLQTRRYSKEQRTALLADAEKKLEKTVRKNNKSLDEVRSDLAFPESMENGAVLCDWTTFPYGILDEDGSLSEDLKEDGTLVEIQCILTCQEQETNVTFYARVFPPALPEKERLWKDLGKKIEEADEKEKTTPWLTLPPEINGKSVLWKESEENLPLLLLFLTFLAALCVCVGMDGKVHRQSEQRAVQLALDYPDLLWKLSMLTEAGLTIKSAFLRIGEQYRRNKKREGKQVRFAYEELLTACHEMESGVPEAEAYERFGRRCQLSGYIRLGTYLSQNLRKGSRGLRDFLAREAFSSLEERKNNARRLGEKAGTKLLLPMILMLGIVIAVLMVPAFMNI